jgi:hypothetical protein
MDQKSGDRMRSQMIIPSTSHVAVIANTACQGGGPGSTVSAIDAIVEA